MWSIILLPHPLALFLSFSLLFSQCLVYCVAKRNYKLTGMLNCNSVGFVLAAVANLCTLHCLFQVHIVCMLSIEQLAAIPDFSGLGPLFKSSPKAVDLTESETEYVVRCVKHVFKKHVVFQVSLKASVFLFLLWLYVLKMR